MLDATGPSRPRNAGRYRPFASAECWTLPALRVRGMLDATGPSRPRNAGRYRPFASAECWTLPALRVRGMLDATGPSRPRNAGRYRPFASAECWTLPALRVRGMLDATGPSRPRNAGRYRPFASAECWTLPAHLFGQNRSVLVRGQEEQDLAGPAPDQAGVECSFGYRVPPPPTGRTLGTLKPVGCDEPKGIRSEERDESFNDLLSSGLSVGKANAVSEGQGQCADD